MSLPLQQFSLFVRLMFYLNLFLLMSTSSFAKPSSHRFKELILHERIVPFDDSMAGDDYYGDFSDGNANPGKSNLRAANQVKVPESTSGSQLTHNPDSQSGGSTSESLLAIGNVQEEEKTTKSREENGYGIDRHEVHEIGKRPGKEDMVSGKGDVQGQSTGPVATTMTTGSATKTVPRSAEKVGDHDHAPKFHDPCRYVYCRVGRICEPVPNGRGKCVCAGAEHCKGSSKSVCGTDGLVYPSHCELHRSACVKGVHISTDHTEQSCQGHALSNSTTTGSPPTSDDDLEDVSEKTPKPLNPTPYSSYLHCTKNDLKTMISSLIDSHCSKPGLNLSCIDVHDRRIVVNNIFRFFDRNGDDYLDVSELKDAQSHENLTKISVHCHLTDLLWSIENSDRAGQISSAGFLAMFGVTLATLEESLRIYTTSVTVGNSVELKCDVKGIDRIVWKRKGHSLKDAVDKQIRVFDDGSLYIGDLKLIHMGNYTCQDRMSNDVIQTHVLSVQTLPHVTVHPSAQIHLSGSTATLKCHADGVPRPEVTWEKNEWPLQTNDEHLQRYLFLHNNTVLEIKSVDYKYDTGAYKCKAKNSAGTSDQVAAVFIENVATSKDSLYLKQSELFAIFHDTGYTIYEVSHCHTEHQVTKDFRGFKISSEGKETLDTLCAHNDSCSWADAVLVKNKFVYVAQPALNRVVVIELDRSNPIEMVLMKCSPLKLTFVEHLDEVWVTCRRNEASSQSAPLQSVIIIRQASSDHPHFASPMTTKGSAEITELFLPADKSREQNFEYGYVVKENAMALTKLHLASVVYAKEISLREYGCLPRSVHFIPVGGLVLVGCRANESEVKPSFHLLLDYITDGLLERLEVNGDSYLSPDGRNVVIIGDRGNTAFVFKVTDDGVLRHVFDEYTQLRLDDVAFFPSESGFEYDAFITSADQATILHLDLDFGRVSTMEGLSEDPVGRLPEAGHSRVIVGGGPFAEHLMSSSKKSVVAIDGRRRRILCEWRDVFNARVMTSLPEYRSD